MLGLGAVLTQQDEQKKEFVVAFASCSNNATESRAGVANLDADGLSRNPCTSQQDVTGARWHDEVDEEMVPGWHASAFLCLLLGVGSTRGRTMASYSSQGVDVGPSYPLGDPEDGGGDTDQRDVHHN
ncbi:unnamed protein product [Calypogeia fissa]